MTDTAGKTLAAKIAAAALDVGGKLKADKRNNQQNYAYISADKVLAVCGQALAEQGISVIPQVTGRNMTYWKPEDGKGRWDADLTMVMLVTDGVTDVFAPWAGWGSDYVSPDKAAYKALTTGHKYFNLKLLSIGEGNEDGEHETEEPAPVVRQPAKSNGKPVQEPPAVMRPAPVETPAPVQPTNGNGKQAEPPAPMTEWPNATVQAVAAKWELQGNRARNLLNLSSLPRETSIDLAINWVTTYRDFRDGGMTTNEAADAANTKHDLGAVA